MVSSLIHSCCLTSLLGASHRHLCPHDHPRSHEYATLDFTSTLAFTSNKAFYCLALPSRLLVATGRGSLTRTKLRRGLHVCLVTDIQLVLRRFHIYTRNSPSIVCSQEHPSSELSRARTPLCDFVLISETLATIFVVLLLLQAAISLSVLRSLTSFRQAVCFALLSQATFKTLTGSPRLFEVGRHIVGNLFLLFCVALTGLSVSSPRTSPALTSSHSEVSVLVLCCSWEIWWRHASYPCCPRTLSEISDGRDFRVGTFTSLRHSVYLTRLLRAVFSRRRFCHFCSHEHLFYFYSQYMARPRQETVNSRKLEPRCASAR